MPDQEIANAELSGAKRAAVLLMTLGEEEAAQILKYMAPEEVQSLGSAMAELTSVTQEDISGTLDQFVNNIGNESSLSIGSQDYLKRILTRALGREKANNMMARVVVGDKPTGLEALRWMTPKSVANVIRDENPQIIAIILTHLDREHAGEVLAQLPEEAQPDILMRIASLKAVHPSALEELDEILEQRFAADPEVEIGGIGGTKAAAEILNTVDADTETRVIDTIKDADLEMCEDIQEKMFVFENLLALDDRGMQSMLREVANEKLVIALKGASAAMSEKIFRNMSKNAAEMLRDDLEAMGPVRLSEVEEAQKSIIAIAQRMNEEGLIALAGKGDEFV
ncbi:MAG: flagellar motor switch protein FliG [bacterium]